MAVAVAELSEPGASDLLRVFDELDVPKGYRAELIEGEIVVSPPPFGNHEHDLALFAKQVHRRSATEMHVAGTKGVVTPRGLFIPDGVVVHEGLLRGMEPWEPMDKVAMVVEATSSRPDTDREVKRRGYAEAGVPLYLLVDRDRREVVLFSQPGDGDYRADVRVPFGRPIDLPEPFSFTLETESFV